MSKNPLDYRTPREDAVPWSFFRPLSRREIAVTLLIVLATFVVGWILLIGPTGVQFRLDTGDLKYTYFGIPGNTVRMSEPERSTILSLAAGSSILQPRWVSMQYDPAHNPHRFRASMYRRAAAWARVDRRITKALLEDLAGEITGRQPQQTPNLFHILLGSEVISGKRWKFLDPSIETAFNDYLKSKGIPIPTTTPATKPSG